MWRTEPRFRDRHQAGRELAERLEHLRGRKDLAVVALPRGGVPVGFEVASALDAPLDVMVVRKLGVPGQEELAMGALASGDISVFNEGVIRHLGISEETIARALARARVELRERENAYRGDGSMIDIESKTVIVVDDGLATGSTVRAAVRALRELQPARIVAAVPVAAPSVLRSLETEADEAIAVIQPEHMAAIGMWYEDFRQLDDDEVRALLERSRRQMEKGKGEESQ